MSSFFLVATLINSLKWALYLYYSDISGLGHVQYWLIVGLAINLLFNLPIKELYFVKNKAAIIFAALINSVSISYVLCFNLVLLHSISAPFDLQLKWFYFPKLVLIIPVLFAMFYDQYNMRRNFKEQFDDRMQLSSLHSTHSLNLTILLSVMTIYFASLAYYGFLALTTPSGGSSEKVRFTSAAIMLTLFLTFTSAFVAVLPFES